MDRESFHLRPDGERAFGFAQAVRAGDTLYLAGSLSVGDDYRPLHLDDMGAQLREAYGAILRTLEHFGAGPGNVVRETIYVTDMDAFLAANAYRLEVYAGVALPAATAVQVARLAFPECIVEIEVTAVL